MNEVKRGPKGGTIGLDDPEEVPVRRDFRVQAVRERTAFGRAYPGVWVVEVEGWHGEPPIPGEVLVPRV